MLVSLVSVVGIRFAGVLIVGGLLHRGLAAIWVVLAGELFVRGVLAYARFWQGGWKHVKV
jgi:Na+-driven multidrug efflux pump